MADMVLNFGRNILQKDKDKAPGTDLHEHDARLLVGGEVVAAVSELHELARRSVELEAVVPEEFARGAAVPDGLDAARERA